MYPGEKYPVDRYFQFLRDCTIQNRDEHPYLFPEYISGPKSH
jgi:hypothetical protein